MTEDLPSLSGSATKARAAFAVLLTVVIVAAIYFFHERKLVKQLTSENSAVISTLNATRDQMSALTAKVDAMSAVPPAPKWTSPSSVFSRKPAAPASAHHRVDDPGWKKVQGQLDEQAKQIDSTREDLTNTRKELQGSIATTHDELVLLEKKGERSYTEFDLDKSGQFQREGPVGIRLRKANTKHEYADLELLVDDFTVSRKHVNIYEPVVSYSGDRKMPIELVINSISRNHIHGYVSEPKYKAADLEAMANSSSNNAAGNANGLQDGTPAKPSPARQRLEPPK